MDLLRCRREVINLFLSLSALLSVLALLANYSSKFNRIRIVVLRQFAVRQGYDLIVEVNVIAGVPEKSSVGFRSW